MAINVNVRVARAVPQVNTEGLTLVIFKNARKSASVTDTIVEVNTLDSLYGNFDSTANTTLVQQKELYIAEYLIRAGVNLLCYSTDVAGTIDADDIAEFDDIEVLDYTMVVVPYDFISADNPESLLLAFAKANDIQLFMDLDPESDSTTVAATVTALGTNVSAKLELFTNSGLARFGSGYALVPAEFDVDKDFFGIPASAVAVARKAILMKDGTPWLPVAGETYGMVNEFSSLFTRLSTAEKEAFQAANINVLLTKTGIGNLFVSQNTLYPYAVGEESNPLIRSHVVTEALYIKRLLKRIAEGLMYAPNNIKTWNTFSLKAKALFSDMQDKEGIEDFSVQVGKGITMTEQDIADGKFKAVVTFLPIRVIEDITFNIVIQEMADAYQVEIVGGDL